METIEDGHTGWLVDPTPESWAGALAAAGDRERLRAAGRAAWQRTLEHYGPAAYQRRLEAIYRSLVS
jgi:glycosyltransferase involved in cell wall biosynthesis